MSAAQTMMPYDGDPCACVNCADEDATIFYKGEAVCLTCCQACEINAQAARIADLTRQLAEAREVKPLEWKPRKNFNGDWVAKTPWGQYSVGCIHGEWWWFFEHLQDGIDKTAKGRSGTERGAKSAAFADHKRRIHSALKGPTP